MITFNQFGPSQIYHSCLSVREGDKIIFKCEQCEYIKILDLKTGKSRTENNDRIEVCHSGSFSGFGSVNVDFSKN